MKAFYAGILIGLGAVANLAIGGLAGAAVFAFALLMICALKFELFTGKVGATILGQYKLSNLAQAYLFNALGIIFVAGLACVSPIADKLMSEASAIAAVRISNAWY